MKENDLFQNFNLYVFAKIATNRDSVSVNLDSVSFNGFLWIPRKQETLKMLHRLFLYWEGRTTAEQEFGGIKM